MTFLLKPSLFRFESEELEGVNCRGLASVSREKLDRRQRDRETGHEEW